MRSAPRSVKRSSTTCDCYPSTSTTAPLHGIGRGAFLIPLMCQQMSLFFNGRLRHDWDFGSLAFGLGGDNMSLS
eukprot:3560983-Amphidinium_carterae.1